MKLKKIISVLTIFIIIIGTCYAASKPSNHLMMFIDIPTAFIIFTIAFAYTIAKGENYIDNFANGATYAGLIGFLIGLISLSYTFASDDPNLKDIMIANSITWLALLYGLIVRIIAKAIKP